MHLGYTEQRLQSLYRGDWLASDYGRPQLKPTDRTQIARRVYDTTDLWDFADPRWLAVEMNLRLCPVSMIATGGECFVQRRVVRPNGEVTHGDIYFVPHADRRERGFNICHGIAHAALSLEGWRFEESDAWWLTGEIVAPSWRLRSHGRSTVVREGHAPEWFLRLWCDHAHHGVVPLRAAS